MTRPEEIERLRLRLADAMSNRKRKLTAILLARLHSLVLRQLNAEMKEERRRVA